MKILWRDYLFTSIWVVSFKGIIRLILIGPRLEPQDGYFSLLPGRLSALTPVSFCKDDKLASVSYKSEPCEVFFSMVGQIFPASSSCWSFCFNDFVCWLTDCRLWFMLAMACVILPPLLFSWVLVWFRRIVTSAPARLRDLLFSFYPEHEICLPLPDGSRFTYSRCCFIADADAGASQSSSSSLARSLRCFCKSAFSFLLVIRI